MNVSVGLRVGSCAAAMSGLTLWAAGAAHATVVIDQSNLVDVTKGALLSSGVTAPGSGFGGAQQVQTITAGLDGILARIDLQVFIPVDFGSEAVQISIYDGDYAMAQGVSGGTSGGFAPLVGVLSSPDVPTKAEAQSGELVSFDTTGLNFHVQAGQVFSVLLAATQGSSGIVGWAYGYQPDPNTVVGLDYAGGYNSRQQGAGNFIATDFDRGFRTEVDVSPAPEPSMWGLMLAGLGGLGMLLRRRRANTALTAVNGAPCLG